MSWYALAERYVAAIERQVAANERNVESLVRRNEADTQLCESNAKRNDFLNSYDDRTLDAQLVRTDIVENVGKFMGGIIEKLTRIETALPSGATREEPK